VLIFYEIKSYRELFASLPERGGSSADGVGLERIG